MNVTTTARETYTAAVIPSAKTLPNLKTRVENTGHGNAKAGAGEPPWVVKGLGPQKQV